MGLTVEEDLRQVIRLAMLEEATGIYAYTFYNYTSIARVVANEVNNDPSILGDFKLEVLAFDIESTISVNNQTTNQIQTIIDWLIG